MKLIPRRLFSNVRAVSGKIVLRYVAFQLLGLAVFVLVLLIFRKLVYVYPMWLFWVLTLLWMVKDALLFPLFWKAYDWESGNESLSMAGMKAVARDRLDPSGYVEVRGELWKAVIRKDTRPVEKGERVRIQDKEGLTLIVEQYDDLS